jgi:hypothetical protein
MIDNGGIQKGKKKKIAKKRGGAVRGREKNKIKKTHLGLLLELWYEWNGQAF